LLLLLEPAIDHSRKDLPLDVFETGWGVGGWTRRVCGWVWVGGCGWVGVGGCVGGGRVEGRAYAIATIYSAVPPACPCACQLSCVHVWVGGVHQQWSAL
jgi:hypothetical protein